MQRETRGLELPRPSKVLQSLRQDAPKRKDPTTDPRSLPSPLTTLKCRSVDDDHSLLIFVSSVAPDGGWHAEVQTPHLTPSSVYRGL